MYIIYNIKERMERRTSSCSKNGIQKMQGEPQRESIVVLARGNKKGFKRWRKKSFESKLGSR